MDKIFAEVENYINITRHKANAKKELTTIAMKQDKTVFEFYHWIFDLWTITDIQSEDQIEMFQALLLPWIYNQLSMKQHTDFNTLLYDARLVEEMQKENAICFLHQNKPMYNQSSSFDCVVLTNTSASKNACGNSCTRGFSVDQQGSYRTPWLQSLLDGLSNGTNQKQALQNW